MPYSLILCLFLHYFLLPMLKTNWRTCNFIYPNVAAPLRLRLFSSAFASCVFFLNIFCRDFCDSLLWFLCQDSSVLLKIFVFHPMPSQMRSRVFFICCFCMDVSNKLLLYILTCFMVVCVCFSVRYNKTYFNIFRSIFFYYKFFQIFL